jgi:hypothetical protein
MAGGRAALIAVLLALVAGAVAAGVGALRSGSATGDELDDVDGVPLLRGAYRTDGPLADGLTVPVGTVLLGDMLPADDIYISRPEHGTGWRAFLLVTGGFPDVVAELADQASELGLPASIDEFWNRCYPPDVDGIAGCYLRWSDDSRALQASMWRGFVTSRTEPPGRPISLLQIELADVPAAAAPTPPSTSVPASTSVPPPTTVVTSDAVPSASTVVPPPSRAIAAGLGPAFAPVAAISGRDVPRGDDVVDPPFPEGWTDPPGPGELLGHGIVTPPPEIDQVLSLRVPHGAHAVVAPWPAPEGHGPIYGALLAVTGDLDAVMDDLAGQIAGRVDGDPAIERGTVGGATVQSTHGSQAGGDEYLATAVTIDGRSWVWVRTGYD